MTDPLRSFPGLAKPPNAGNSTLPPRAPSALKTIFVASHPFLLAIAPIVHLYSQNINEADIATAVIFGGGALMMTAVLLLFAWLWQRNLAKAALIVSLFNVLFYGYGWAFDALMQHEPFKLSYGQWHFALLLLGLSIVLTAGVVVRHTRRNLGPLSQFLSGAMLIFVIMCLARIAQHDLRILWAHHKTGPAAVKSLAGHNDRPRMTPLETDSPATPDVYYIILDGYDRADALQRICQFDNSTFIEFLRSRGFFVASESCANYPMTFMSLASSLNMCYLEEELNSPGYSAVYAMWDRPAVAREFQSRGYRFVYLATNFRSSLQGEDVVFQPRPAWLLNQFAETLLRTTALRLLEPQMADQHEYQFEKIQQVSRIDGPTFTFCHIVAPHPPYVFDRYGNVCCRVPQSMFFKDGAEQQQDPSNQQARRAYVEQLQYINQKMQEIVDNILAQSKFPPIIILQGDHGTFFTLPAKMTEETLDQFAQERLPILNAYLVPEKMRRKLRPDISPVNSFRLLFNECFGGHFELLPEKHYVGWYYNVEHLRDATQVVHRSAATQDAAMAGKPD